MAVINNRALAKTVEDLKILGTKRYMDIQREASSFYIGNYYSLESKGDIFYTSEYCYGLGFGLDGEVLAADLEALERYIVSRNISSHLHLEITPFCPQPFLALLQEKGYTLDHFLAVWILETDQWEPKINDGVNLDLSIVQVDESSSFDWAWTVALGISADHTVNEEAMESVRAFYEVPNNTAFLLKEGEENVAGATIAIEGELAELFLTGTIKPFRERGHQNRLIEERIRFAKNQGCKYVTVTTKPGTSSSRNMEMNGFKLMYHRAVLKSPLI